jgi:hypothetical protein
MAIDASEAGHRLAVLQGDYLFESGLDDDLKEAERIYVILWRFQAELYNGGVWQFFSNSRGIYNQFLCDALKTVGAESMVPSIEVALEQFRPGKPWHDAMMRSTALYAAPEDVRKQVHELDDRLAPDIDGLSVKLFHYLSRHRNQFNRLDDF